MTPTSQTSPQRPLYRDPRVDEPRAPFHLGLWADKFADRWEPGFQGFDKDAWIDDLVRRARSAVDAALLAEHVERQRRLAERAGGIVVTLKNTSRFVTGLGRPHPTENGFAWHPTLGVPYLPGSSLKGLLRAAAQAAGESLAPFGQPSQVGELVVLDLLPLQPPTLVRDLLNPHYAPYYQAADVPPEPGDWFDPVPIPFLVVERGQRWQAALLPRLGRPAWTEAQARRWRQVVQAAFERWGAGAKTALGYGRFVVVEAPPPAAPEPAPAVRIVTERTRQPTRPQRRQEQLILIRPQKRGQAWIARTHDGHEVVCHNVPAYNARPDRAIVADVERDDAGRPTEARFRGFA